MLFSFFFFNDTATTEIYTLFPTRRSSDLDVCLHPLRPLVPDGPDRQITLVDAEGGFGFGELDVGPPQVLCGPPRHVRPQDVAAFCLLRPLGPFRPLAPRELQPRGPLRGRPHLDLERPRRVCCAPAGARSAAPPGSHRA